MNGEKSNNPYQKRGILQLGEETVSPTDDMDPRKKGKHGGGEELSLKLTGEQTTEAQDIARMESKQQKGTLANKDSAMLRWVRQESKTMHAWKTVKGQRALMKNLWQTNILMLLVPKGCCV